VYAYVAFRIGRGPDAEDVTSEVFERAVRYRASYDRRKGAPLAWLFGIARGCIADHVARRVVSGGEPDDVAMLGDLEGDTVERLALRDAVRRLGPRDRELIALRYGADLSAREIGELLGERTNTIEVALHRAVSRLRDDLDAGPRGAPAPQAVR
jgi:RNA polymerase sigma-70 factor (ECF subfamily)